MANTLTNLIPTMYTALDVVSRELIGFIPAVTRDSRVERAAKDQSVRSPVVPAATAADITPGVTAPDSGDQTIDNVEITISKSRAVHVRWNGEETKGLENAGTYDEIMRDRFAQAFRTLANEVETDLASVYAAASRAYGTAGTTPFATADDLTDVAEVRRILDDNGVPQSELQLVLGSAAMAKMRGKQSSLWKVNEAGTPEFLRQGFISQGLQGFALRNSAQVKTHAAGSLTGTIATSGAAAKGATSITLATDAGEAIAINAGDVVTFAGDSNKYIAAADLDVAASSTGTLTINKPGLRAAVASGTAVTVTSAYAANAAFHRGAIVLATRLPALPKGGDSADDRISVTDPLSGLSFEIAAYRQYRQVIYEVALAWGWKAVKPEHMALLIG